MFIDSTFQELQIIIEDDGSTAAYLLQQLLGNQRLNGLTTQKGKDVNMAQSNTPGLFISRRDIFEVGLLVTIAGWANANQVSENSSEATAPTRVSFKDPQKRLWQAGLKVQTGGSICQELYATFPIPMPWPEQSVLLVDQDLSPYVSGWKTRDLAGGARQILVQMANIPPNTIANAIFTFEITRSQIVGPESTDDLVIPTKVDRDAKMFTGNSPYIDPRHPKIRKVLSDLESLPGETAWTRVEQIYEWVREHVQYREGTIKSAVEAMDDGYGDCEELTSLFVALCRASRIPARVVWIPGHCYPEFMLHDGDGNPHWFPCQAAGTRQFGGMEEIRPVLQKGDRFKVPEKSAVQRYVAEFCKLTAKSKPKVEFVRQMIDES